MSDHDFASEQERQAHRGRLYGEAEQRAEMWRQEAGRAWKQVKMLTDGEKTETALRALDRRSMLLSIQGLYAMLHNLHEFDPDHGKECDGCSELDRAKAIIDDAEAMDEMSCRCGHAFLSHMVGHGRRYCKHCPCEEYAA